MGHEMGYYVLNHQYKGLVIIGVILVIAFAFVNWGIGYALARWGAAWGVRGITDVAVLPLAVMLFAFYFFNITPLNHTVERTMEYEADMYVSMRLGSPIGSSRQRMQLNQFSTRTASTCATDRLVMGQTILRMEPGWVPALR